MQISNESCWAAALESWLESIGEPRRRRTQAQLLRERKEAGIKDVGITVPDFRNLVMGFGMDTVMISADKFSAERIEERLRNSSVLLVGCELEQYSQWWHDFVLYGVSTPAKDEPKYEVMDPAKGAYDTFQKARFFPVGPDEPVLLGWQARGRPGKQW